MFYHSGKRDVPLPLLGVIYPLSGAHLCAGLMGQPDKAGDHFLHGQFL